MRRRSGLMAVSVMRCSCLNGGCQSPILRQDAAGLEAARILSPSKARALESKAAPGPAGFYRVSGFVHWHFFALRDLGLNRVGSVSASAEFSRHPVHRGGHPKSVTKPERVSCLFDAASLEPLVPKC